MGSEAFAAPSRYRLGPSGIAPRRDDVEVELHHEWKIVEQKVLVHAVRIETSPGTEQQTWNSTLGEMPHVGRSRGRTDAKRGNAVALGQMTHQRAELGPRAGYRLGGEACPREHGWMGIAVRLGVLGALLGQ